MADTPDLRVAAGWLEGEASGAPSGGGAGWTLDLGAGLGTNGFALIRRGHRVLAADTSLDRLREARRRVGQLDLPPGRLGLVVAAAEALPFADGALDRAFTKSVLIHTDVPKAAGELARVLRPGGRAALVEPQPGNPFARLYRGLLAPKAWSAITRYFDAAAQRETVEPFGAPPLERAVRPFYLFSFLAFAFQFAWPNPGLLHALLKPLNGLDDRIFRLIPALQRWAWFGVILVAKEGAEEPAQGDGTSSRF
jgi:SAM-dependent methyltransferase